VNCEVGYTSNTDSKHCELAEVDYFLKYPDRNSSKCPQNAVCLGDDYLPIPDKGYWVDHDAYEYAADFYKCFRDTCIGGLKFDNLTCWKIGVLESVYCDADQMQCKDGSEGPLCGSCSHGYVYRGSLNTCARCEGAQLQSLIIFGCMLFLACIGSLAYYQKDSFLLSRMTALQFLFHLESGSLKVSSCFSSLLFYFKRDICMCSCYQKYGLFSYS
jgi:hypothetical protein